MLYTFTYSVKLPLVEVIFTANAIEDNAKIVRLAIQNFQDLFLSPMFFKPWL